MLRAALLLLLLFPGNATCRTWTDSTGKHQTEADLVEFKGDTVYLRKASGRVVAVPFRRLSVDDKRFIQASGAVQVLDGTVIGLASGDLLRLIDAVKDQHLVRLDGIDAPELEQDISSQARKALALKVLRKPVVVKWKHKSADGAISGHVFTDGQWINKALVANGLAWHYKDFNTSTALAGAEQASRLAKIGLWKEPGALAPWEFRSRSVIKTSEEAAGSDLSDDATETDDPKRTVYVTLKDPRYHKVDCRHVKVSGIPVPFNEVHGLYSACRECHLELRRVIVSRPDPEPVVRAPRPRRSYNRTPYFPTPGQMSGGRIGNGGSFVLGGDRSGSGGIVNVRGYYRSDGTYVRPHTRRAPRR